MIIQFLPVLVRVQALLELPQSKKHNNFDLATQKTKQS